VQISVQSKDEDTLTIHQILRGERPSLGVGLHEELDREPSVTTPYPCRCSRRRAAATTWPYNIMQSDVPQSSISGAGAQVPGHKRRLVRSDTPPVPYPGPSDYWHRPYRFMRMNIRSVAIRSTMTIRWSSRIEKCD
jgi:hypothetical protein